MAKGLGVEYGTQQQPAGAVGLVLVLDFGGQYNQLIARRVRECGVYSEMLPYDTPLAEIAARQPVAVIFSGGPASVYGKDSPRSDRRIYELGIPVLGICYGLQLMTHDLGGEVRPAEGREYGRTTVWLDSADALFSTLTEEQQCWMSHGDLIVKTPPGFRITARTRATPIAAMSNPQRRLYGVQFHPEVHHTPAGRQILEHFLFDVCGLKPEWTPASYIAGEVEAIRRQVGEEEVICGLSGGVDSAVAATLVHRAVGDRLTCIFVDHGLLRLGEAEDVSRTFNRMGVRLVFVRASERFWGRLQGTTDPEAKRKVIGEEFIRVFEEEARRTGGARYLVQGTLYSDVIESGTGTAARIKSHHNVGGLPDEMELELVEPLRQLFKDEVRRVGLELGLPESLVWRHPFPGPGLAVRILDEVTPEKVGLVQQADAIIDQEVRAAGLYRSLWQCFAVLPALRSVGVMGDSRTYGYTVAVRAVTSEDAMTADWARLPYEVLERISSRITNEVEGVNRVVYDITSKPPGTIEWE